MKEKNEEGGKYQESDGGHPDRPIGTSHAALKGGGDKKRSKVRLPRGNGVVFVRGLDKMLPMHGVRSSKTWDPTYKLRQSPLRQKGSPNSFVQNSEKRKHT